MSAPPYSIGSTVLPGLSRLLEEAGEAVQVVGKIVGAGHAGEHFDGSDLSARLVEEVADLTAAIRFVVEANGLDEGEIGSRVAAKFATYWRWHRKELGEPLDRDRPPTFRWDDGDYRGSR